MTIPMSQPFCRPCALGERSSRQGRPDPPVWLPLTRADMPSFECGRWNLVYIRCFAARTTQGNRQLISVFPFPGAPKQGRRSAPNVLLK